MFKRFILGIALTSCLPTAEVTLPPDALATAANVPNTAAPEAELTRVSAIDPNRGPVTIWSVGRGEDISALYLIGHAEEQCCRALSELMHDIEDRPELTDGWTTFGFGAFQAGSRPGGAALLSQSLERARRLTGKDGVCHGQALLKHVTNDPMETGAKLAAASQGALDRAKREGRPIIAYFPGGEEPTLAPIFTPGRDGAMKALDFRLPRGAVRPPEKLLSSLTLGDAIEEVLDLREQKRQIELAIQTRQKREPLAHLPVLGPVDEKHTAFGANIKKRLTEELAQLRAIDDERQRFCVLASAAPDSIPMIQRWRTHACETLRDEVSGLIRGFTAELRTFDAEGNASKVFEWRFFRAIPADPAVEQMYARLLDEVDERALQRKLAESDRILRLAYAASGNVRIDPADAAEIILDAALRGWPATFIDDESEHAFDAWNAKNQGPLWEMAFASMRRSGVAWAHGGDNPLLTSTLLFRVADTGEAFKVVPFHVLGGDFFMIADPGSNTVRFEATTTQQNLRGT